MKIDFKLLINLLFCGLFPSASFAHPGFHSHPHSIESGSEILVNTYLIEEVLLAVIILFLGFKLLSMVLNRFHMNQNSLHMRNRINN